MRTHTCSELNESHIGQTVTLCGWVNAYRGHGGGLIFVDMRDRAGITQVVFDSEDGNEATMEAGDRLRNEDCIKIVGVVRARGKSNPKIPTGAIEVLVTELEVLSKTNKLPFIPSNEKDLPNEEVRLRYRYIDMRRPTMQHILRTRHRVAKLTRDYFDQHEFIEVETPVLCRSTPEGARDFLVPSRNQEGMWYALPQSPQLFKQILMVGGCDRYLQIVKCFRDEDPRADRQAEFTQIDLEMSFVDRDEVLEIMEGYAKTIWKQMLDVDLPDFPRMTYREAMDTYGIDRPDTRFDLKLVDISDLAAKGGVHGLRRGTRQEQGRGQGHPCARRSYQVLTQGHRTSLTPSSSSSAQAAHQPSSIPKASSPPGSPSSSATSRTSWSSVLGSKTATPWSSGPTPTTSAPRPSASFA